jgi:hypothetical protein
MDSAALFCAGFTKDILRVLGRLKDFAPGLKTLGKGLSIVGAVLGIVSGVLEILDGYSKFDRRMYAKHVIDVTASFLTLGSILLEEGAMFGPWGVAAAAIAIGGMAVYDAITGEAEVPEAPMMNQVVEALVWRLESGHDTKPFLGLLLANEEHGDELDSLLFQLDPNGSWTHAPKLGRPPKPPCAEPWFPLISGVKARAELKGAGFEDNVIDAVAPHPEGQGGASGLP